MTTVEELQLEIRALKEERDKWKAHFLNAVQCEADTEAEAKALRDLCEEAWGVIANAGLPEGNWDMLTAGWQEAAARWRDKYHAALTRTAPDSAEEKGGEG